MTKLTLLFALLFAASAVQAQDHDMAGGHDGAEHAMHQNMPPMRANDSARPSPNAGVMQTIGTTTVMVHYSRPSAKGRTIFASSDDALVPLGKVWRTGANEATAVSFSGDVMIGGETLPAGTYGLFTIPGESEWTIIFNNVAEQWGSMGYDEAEDALRVMAAPISGGPAQEQFEISFENVTAEGGVMVLAWDDVRVPVSISVAG
ncbi:DUF2911 domain-containing protein [Rubricoccus marinus]|nr:DUF2911 domain-containing protein [Rubricoccus marinus]